MNQQENQTTEEFIQQRLLMNFTIRYQKNDVVNAFEEYANIRTASLIQTIENRVKELEATPAGWLDSERLVLINDYKNTLKLLQG